MKKIAFILSGILVLSVFLFGSSILGTTTDTSEVSEKLEIATAHGSFHIYESVDELEKQADVIVKAKFTGNAEVEDFYQSGILVDSARKTEMSIIKSHKGNLERKDQIIVYEPGYVRDGVLNTIEGYVPINEKGTYVLFLRDNLDGTYVGLGVYQGKYNIAKSQKEEAFDEVTITTEELEKRDIISDHPEDFNKLKEKVLKKFKN